MYRCALVCSSKFQCAQVLTEHTGRGNTLKVCTVRTKCACKKLKVCTWCAQVCTVRRGNSPGEFPRRTEHTMSVLSTLLSNFVRIFYRVCTLCANLCEPACTACKCLRSTHSAYKQCTWGVRSMHSIHKAYTKCTGGVRSL